MKGLFKKLGLCVLAGTAVLGFTSCDDKDPTPVETETDVQNAKTDALAALNAAIDALDQNSYDDATWNDFLTIKSYGELFINGSSTVANVNSNLAIITEALEAAKTSAVPLANGVYSYVASSYAERAEILGILERYAVNNGLTGLTMWEDAGYVMYNPIVKKGTENYITGYGFGILTEGSLTGDLAGETNSAWKRYWHEYEVTDPAAIYYGDDKGSVVGDLAGYIFGSMYAAYMNETKDGYDWTLGEFAKSMPEPLNQNSKGLASKYRIEIKVGSELKYSTNSKVAELAAFNNRELELEDYLTPYKLLHTQANGFARGGEGLNDPSTIKGLAKYYNSTASGRDDAAFENVALKTYMENGKAYLEFEYNLPCSEFYAMYYINSSLYAPIPQDFLDIVGDQYWGKFDGTRNWSPVDTTLATGQYVLEAWDRNQQIVFKKNPNTDDGKHYQIAGIHVNILAAASTDSEAAFKEFLADKLHAASIPHTQLDSYRNDPRTTTTIGTSTTKLNINTCTQAEWEKLFGKNGSIVQTELNEYWECEPALSNEDFIKGLSYALNRKEFAEKIGRMPSASYFGAGYMADPEAGISYNSTQYHKDAVADLVSGTDGYGYSLELARAAFKRAAEKLLADGLYNEGDTIEIQIAWQTQSNVTDYQDILKTYWEGAFNDASVCGGKLTLKITDWVGATWSDVYYEKMMTGQFDIGFGGINGNSLNPLNFFEVLKSDNSSGFTLNWGPDTSVVDPTLMWDGVAWSFDSLWKVADAGGYVNKGHVVPVHNSELVSETANEDGSFTYSVKANIVKGVQDLKSEITRVMIGITGYGVEDEVEFTYDAATDTVTITIDAETAAWYAEYLAYGYPVDLQVVFTDTVLDIPVEAIDYVAIALGLDD